MSFTIIVLKWSMSFSINRNNSLKCLFSILWVFNQPCIQVTLFRMYLLLYRVEIVLVDLLLLLMESCLTDKWNHFVESLNVTVPIAPTLMFDRKVRVMITLLSGLYPSYRLIFIKCIVVFSVVAFPYSQFKALQKNIRNMFHIKCIMRNKAYLVQFQFSEF